MLRLLVLLEDAAGELPPAELLDGAPWELPLSELFDAAAGALAPAELLEEADWELTLPELLDAAAGELLAALEDSARELLLPESR